MLTLQVFDPALCCSTGVCGPQVDPALVTVASDLAWLRAQGVTVEWFNLGQQPQEFVSRPFILEEMQQDPHVLPVVAVDGQIVSRKSYLSRVDLAALFGLKAPEKKAPEKRLSLNMVACDSTDGCC